MPIVTETPSGFVVTCPWKTLDKALIVDVKAFLASERFTRNVLTTRISAKSASGILKEEAFILSMPVSGVPVFRDFEPAPGNIALLIASNYPVLLELTTETGSLSLGQNTLFVITAPVVKVRISNTAGIGNAEVNVLSV